MRFRDTYSSNPASVAMRTARLLDDAKEAKSSEHTKRSHGKRRTETITKRALARTYVLVRRNGDKVMRARIAHHLARGRDAGDIAVREGWMLSEVQRIIATLP